MEEIKNWLHNNYEPWDSIKVCWKKSFQIRRMDILEGDFDKILDAWPRYKKSIGFELVDIDFSCLYPESNDSLKHFWHEYSAKIIEVALKESRKKKDKDAISRFKKHPPAGDEDRNFVGCLALHAIFFMCPSKNKNSKQSLDKMFLRAQRGAMINEEIQRISEECKKLKEDMNPFIIYFENDVGIPYKFFVCVNHLIYETTNFITAIDTLFKTYFVFNLKYPTKCISVLTFIQHFFYKIFLPSDVYYSTILSFMFEINIERATECEKMMK